MHYDIKRILNGNRPQPRSRPFDRQPGVARARNASINAIRERCVKFAYDWSGCAGDEKQTVNIVMRELMKAFRHTGAKRFHERRSNRASTGARIHRRSSSARRSRDEVRGRTDKAEEQVVGITSTTSQTSETHASSSATSPYLIVDPATTSWAANG